MRIPVGPQPIDEHGWEFVVWAPLRKRVQLKLPRQDGRLLPMEADSRGYWRVKVNGLPPAGEYFYQLDDGPAWPDPASPFQPHGVHQPSSVVDHSAFVWEDAGWKNMPMASYIIYELHVGTFTAAGTFDGAIERLDDLCDLGITAVEIMPVAQFSGGRNWGYDGVHPFAVQNTYGGPEGLKRLVNACHLRGLAVILDVVYNHLGPEGNYLGQFAPYFTDRHRTPWGEAINLDGPYSDGVRNYFYENALYWFDHFHMDALRLDAVHGMFDMSAKHFLAEMQERTEALSEQFGRPLYLIAESDLNDTRIIRSRAEGGYQLASQWSDDVHHAFHTVLTGEKTGYYEDFGTLHQLALSLRQGYVYDWQYSVHRKRFHGSDPSGLSPEKFVVCLQNHDQVGNRMLGERMSSLTNFSLLKTGAVALLMSPYIPLLFMGEEHGEDNPFLYFVSHTDPGLVEAVRKGRKAEFSSFKWQGDPPDPQSEETFARSRPDWTKRQRGQHRVMWQLYRFLLRLRKEHPALVVSAEAGCDVDCREAEGLLYLVRAVAEMRVAVILNFSPSGRSLPSDELFSGPARRRLDTADATWDGAGSMAPDEINGTTTLTLAAQSAQIWEAKTK